MTSITDDAYGTESIFLPKEPHLAVVKLTDRYCVTSIHSAEVMKREILSTHNSVEAARAAADRLNAEVAKTPAP